MEPTEIKGTPARRRLRASPQARRAQILAAALRCFSEKGYHEATMDDVAREAGLSKGSLYWHFSSKADLFLGLSGAFALELFTAWEALGRSHRGGTVELLERLGAVTIETIGAQGSLVRAWAEFIVNREIRDLFAGIYTESRRRLGVWIQQGIAAGEIRPDDPESLAAALTALIEGLLLQTLVDPGFDVRRHWRAGWEVFARGIAA